MIDVSGSIKYELCNFPLGPLSGIALAFLFHVTHASTFVAPFCNKRNRLNRYTMIVM